MYYIFKAVSPAVVLRGLPRHLNTRWDCLPRVRNYTDTPSSESKKVVVKVQGTDTEQRLRVRLARPSDVPRVLSFVHQHECVWPGALAPASRLAVEDYVSRALAQGHSILAEQQPHPSRPELRGLALGAAVCPWDAGLLERWANCLRCRRSRRLMHFTAHCLRAPQLHDKYRVRNILQMILIVPLGTPKSDEIVQILAKNAIKRGKDAGFPLIRFDATADCVAQPLEKLQLTREWSLSYNILTGTQTEDPQGSKKDTNRTRKIKPSNGSIVVYTTSLMDTDKRTSKK